MYINAPFTCFYARKDSGVCGCMGIHVVWFAEVQGSGLVYKARTCCALTGLTVPLRRRNFVSRMHRGLCSIPELFPEMLPELLVPQFLPSHLLAAKTTMTEEVLPRHDSSTDKMCRQCSSVFAAEELITPGASPLLTFTVQDGDVQDSKEAVGASCMLPLQPSLFPPRPAPSPPSTSLASASDLLPMLAEGSSGRKPLIRSESTQAVKRTLKRPFWQI